jgi:hypothetical protein
LLELANRALAGAPTGSATLSEINAAVDAINRGFDECRAPVNCATGAVIPDSFNDGFVSRPRLEDGGGEGGSPGLDVLGAFNVWALPAAAEAGGTLNFKVRVTNFQAGKEPGEPNHAGNPGGKSVWWQWHCLTTGTVTFETAGSSFDTLLAIYTGTNLANLTQVASNDDQQDLVMAGLSFHALAGVDYQIAVDGYEGAAGNIVLALVATPPRFCQPVIVVGNEVRLCIEGEIGRTYTVEASSDLTNWTIVAAAVIDDGVLQFSDPGAANSSQRFYRAWLSW